MTDRFERSIPGIDGARTPDPAFRARLERAILGAGIQNAAAPRWGIDAPRELPPGVRARIEAAMTRPRRRFVSPVRLMAAAMAAVLVAGATVVVVDRVGRRGGSPEQPIVAGPTLTTSPTPGTTTRPKPNGPSTLRGFRSAGEFLAYVRAEGLKQNTPYGIPGSTSSGWYAGGPVAGPVPGPGSAPGAAPQPIPAMPALGHPASGNEYSETNIQEAGVDEPDIVKTDGRHLLVQTGEDSTLRIFDVKTGARLRDSMRFEDQSPLGILLLDDRAVVFTQRFTAPPAARSATHVTARRWTTVSVLSIADPSRLKVVASLQIEGGFVDARLAGGVVRLVVSSEALGPESVPLGNTYTKKALSAAEAANAKAIRRSVVGDWVPHYVVERSGRATRTGHVHEWSAISRPPDLAGLGMLTVLTIDPANPSPDNAVSVVGSGDEIYASLGNLYVASQRRDDVIAVRNERSSSEVLTRIHKFDISDPARTTYVGSGEVRGILFNQFSMSEYAGRLRVASTVESFDGSTPSTESFVTVLSDTGGRLVRVGRVGNLGKGERIYAVRFIGAIGYVVTFRRIDPLYVLDLSKPNHPRVRGELKVSGFSAYLHPLSESLLLGVGQDATEEGQVRGIQFSLFDIADPRDPRRIANHIEGSFGYSELQYDHHAFLYWAPQKLVVVPATLFGKNETDFSGALALTIDTADGFGEAKRITHAGRPGSKASGAPSNIRRSFVIGNRLYTMSDSGLLLTDLRSFEDLAWVSF